jgi:hypothetical protein
MTYRFLVTNINSWKKDAKNVKQNTMIDWPTGYLKLIKIQTRQVQNTGNLQKQVYYD